MARRAKIVATVGPATSDYESLKGIIKAGADVLRMNFSHGSHEDHAQRIQMVREIARELNRTVGVLGDLQGPKIRLGLVPDPGLELVEGEEVWIFPGVETLDSYEKDGLIAIPVVYEALARDVNTGSMLLIDDGSLRLVVTEVVDNTVRARVVVGGLAKSRKGLNLPGVAVSAPSLTEKDIADLKFMVEQKVDWVALSFVRSARDIRSAQKLVRQYGGNQLIIAKLERPEAIENLDEIIDVTDAVMVARGDMGVEIGPERVPAIQKEIITKANAAGRPVITATEMLDSMIRNPRPTRAEASDVANAIFDGTDAVMLSGETAAGSYPVEAVKTMARIVEVAESQPNYMHHTPARAVPSNDPTMTGRLVSQQAVELANAVNAKAIAVFSLSGWSVQLVSKNRPRMPLVGMVIDEEVKGRTALMWGTQSVVVPMRDHATALLVMAEDNLVNHGYVEPGDVVVLVTGPPGASGGTSRIWVHRIGDQINS